MGIVPMVKSSPIDVQVPENVEKFHTFVNLDVDLDTCKQLAFFSDSQIIAAVAATRGCSRVSESSDKDDGDNKEVATE